MSERPPPRIAPFALPERYDLPGRPAAASPAARDAHRQTHFLLGADLALLEQALNLQLEIATAAARSRTPETAAVLGFWSRTFSYLTDAAALLCRASYASCPPLLRAACDCIAAQRSLLEEGFDEYREWLADAMGKDAEHAAFSIDLGRYRAGSVLAQVARLGAAYRLLTDLTMPHFGSTTLLVGPDSSGQKLTLTFGGGAFHLGWAELTAGWLLLLADAQVETALAAAGEAAAGLGDATARLQGEIEAALAGPRRCRAEEMPDGRRLLHNFRRTPGALPRRLII